MKTKEEILIEESIKYGVAIDDSSYMLNDRDIIDNKTIPSHVALKAMESYHNQFNVTDEEIHEFADNASLRHEDRLSAYKCMTQMGKWMRDKIFQNQDIKNT